MFKVLITTTIEAGSVNGGVHVSTIIVDFEQRFEARAAADIINSGKNYRYSQTAKCLFKD